MAASAPCVSVRALNSVDFPTFGSPTIAVWSFMLSAERVYDRALDCCMFVVDSLPVKDDRDMNAAMDCLTIVVVANSMIICVVWSRLFIGLCLH